MSRTAGQIPLTQERIRTTAMELIDREGLDRFSMRRLAAELGVRPMAIYHYYADKQALLDAAIDAALAECDTAPTSHGLDAVREICRSFRAVARRHAALFLAAMSREAVVRSEIAVAEALLSALVDAGIDEKTAVQRYNTLITYVTGFCSDEITGLLFTFDAESPGLLDAEVVSAFPLVYRLRTLLTDVNADVEFESGLDLLVRGIEDAVGRARDVVR